MALYFFVLQYLYYRVVPYYRRFFFYYYHLIQQPMKKNTEDYLQPIMLFYIIATMLFNDSHECSVLA